MLTVACVLRVGGDTYTADWVTRLQRNVARHLHVPYRFVCLTNLDAIEGIETQPLGENWPGWWAKIELFKPGQFAGPVLYLDLDLMVCGNIDKLAGPWPGLMMLRDRPGLRHVPNSGLMWWDPVARPEYTSIYTDFKLDPWTIMMQYSGVRGISALGDQGFVNATVMHYNLPVGLWQDVLPPAWFLEFSFLQNINPSIADNGYDKAVRVCYALGHPKFPQCPELPIVQAHWEPLGYLADN